MPRVIAARPPRRRRRGPLVSIGIPVFQKEALLAATLDSALAQDHRDLEVILADNGSTDGTAAICRAYARRDRRVRFVQNRWNLGSRRNFNLVFELARGEFFVWGRGHDLWAPDFVSRGLAAMQRDPEVVLWHARCREIDAEGRTRGVVEEALDTRGLPLPARLRAAWRSLIGPATLGVIRTAAMDRTRRYQGLAGCDIVFLLELAAQGTFAFDDEPLLSLRALRAETSEAETIARTWAQMDPFRAANEPPDVHVLDFSQRHLRLLRELPVAPAIRDDLLADLIATYAAKFTGSFARALDATAERVHAAAAAGEAAGAEALDCPTVLALLDRLHTGLLFVPDHARAAAARDLLTALLLELTSTPTAP
jgi:hypothetical protein